jgi:hypothetical protein
LPYWRPLPEKLPAAIETLNAAVLSVGHVDNVALVDLDRVGQAEFAGPRTRASPFVNFLPVCGVLEDPGVAVAVADEQMPVARERRRR